MDLSVIKKHLLYHDFDPFNRDKLCLEELEKYNKDEKIREECNQFMMSLNDWKSKSLLTCGDLGCSESLIFLTNC